MRMSQFLIYIWIPVIAHVLLTWYLSIRRGLRARRLEADEPRSGHGHQLPVSIIVPAWNEQGTIERCIQSLQKITYPSWEAIILAGGPDGTYEAAHQATAGDSRFRVLERGPEPKNVVLTKGVEVAHHDILVLLDADSVVFPDWLGALVEPLASGAAASFGMHLPSRKTWISMAEHMEIIQAYYIFGSTMAQGCSSIAIRREVLVRIGPLPAVAYSWEDWDIDVRLAALGEKVVFVPKARLLTDRPITLVQFWANAVRCYRSHLAGLWYHRAVFSQRPIGALYELYFLSFGATLSLAMVASLVVIVAQPSLLPAIGKAVALVMFWILGRRAALGAEIAAFTGESRWLAWDWAPVVLLPVQILAAFVAILSVWRQPRFDYKGVRYARSS